MRAVYYPFIEQEKPAREGAKSVGTNRPAQNRHERNNPQEKETKTLAYLTQLYLLALLGHI